MCAQPPLNYQRLAARPRDEAAQQVVGIKMFTPGLRNARGPVLSQRSAPRPPRPLLGFTKRS